MPDVFFVCCFCWCFRLGLDAGGGTGSFAAHMAGFNVTVLTTAMNVETVFGRYEVSHSSKPPPKTAHTLVPTTRDRNNIPEAAAAAAVVCHSLREDRQSSLPIS